MLGRFVTRMGWIVRSGPEKGRVDFYGMIGQREEVSEIVDCHSASGLVHHGFLELLEKSQATYVLRLNGAIVFVQYVYEIVASAQKDLLEVGRGSCLIG
jgi:hypothetical protein